MHIPRVIVPTMLGVLAFAVSAGAQNPSAGSLQGAVYARQNGRAVADAVITIDGRAITTFTNQIGRFSVVAPPGTIVVLVEATGFVPFRSEPLELRAGEATSLRIELEPAPAFMERVLVTATKTPLASGDVAAQTDIVDRETIDRRGDLTLTQAIAHVPGAVVSTQLGIFDSVMLRGLPRGDPEFTNTLLLVDGVPQTLSNNGARIVALPINDASSIEVVRGPGSALYGRTAIGGSVNVLTADPTATPEVRLDLTGGQFDTFKGVAKVSGPAGRWGGYYASIGKERSEGYFVNKTTQDFAMGNTSLFGKLSFAPDPRGAGTVSIGHVRSDNSTPTNEPIIEGRLLHEIDPRFDRFTNFNIPGRNYRQRETRATLNYARQLTDSVKLHEVFGYRAVQHRFVEDGDFIAGPFDLAAHTVTMYPFSQQLDEDIVYQEMRLEVTPRGDRLKSSLVIGGSYEWNSGSLESDFIFNDPDLFGFTIDYLTPVIPPRSEWQHDANSRVYHLGVTGVFGQYMFEPTSRLVVAAGARFDRLDLDNTRDGGAKLEAAFQALSPKASVTFKLLGADVGRGPRLNAYGAYSQSFLPPRRPSSLLPADVPLNLEPEDIANYEGGLKGSVLDGKVSFEATYFRMTEDGVVLSTRQGPRFVPTNAGKLRYKGIETGVTAALAAHGMVYMNTSIYRNRFGDFVVQEEEGDTVLTGNRLPISPDYVVNWGGSLTLRDVHASVDIKHVGDVQTNRDNAFLLGAFTVVDAAVSWQRGPRVRITLSAHNLFDQQYYWNGDGETADPGRPRQVLVSTSLLLR